LKGSNRKIAFGEFAENITTEGMDLTKAAILDRFIINDIGTGINSDRERLHGAKCAIFAEVGKCIMPQEGIFCR